MSVPSLQQSPGPDRLFALGMAAVSLAAAVSSYSGLAALADLAGWNHRLALLLPITIDAYALTATRVWLSPKTAGQRARRWAKGNAIGAIATSVAGNAVSHAAAAHVFAPSWPVVVMVSAIPSIVLGLITHLWHLRNTPDSAVPVADGAPVPVTSPATAPATSSGPEAPVPVAATAADDTSSSDAEAPTPVPRNNEHQSGRKTAAQTAQQIAALRTAHPEASQLAIAKKLSLTDRTVRKYWAATAPGSSLIEHVNGSALQPEAA